MTFAWAELALLQAWLLPGLAVTSRCYCLARIDKLLLAAPLSATINFLLVELLTLGHFYNRAALLALACTEVAVVLWNLHDRRNRAVGTVARVNPVSFEDPIDVFIGVACLIVGCALVVVASDQVRHVYESWDAVMSWNRWAVDWYLGRFPSNTWHYPQVLPALMSIPYVAVGDPRLEPFSKSVTVVVPLLYFATAMRIVTLAGESGRVLALGVVVSVLFIGRHLGAQAFGGLADLPAAYMVGSTAYALMLAWSAAADRDRHLLLVLAGVIMGGAMLTKQAGAFALTLTVPWVVFSVRRETPLRDAWKEASVAVLVGLAIAAHWYLYKQYQISVGADGSEIGYVTSIVHMTWTAKIWHGWTALWETSTTIMAVASVTLVAALWSKLGRWVVLVGFAPVFLIWSTFFAYDTRNFAVGMLPLSCSIAIGTLELWRTAASTFGLQRFARGIALAAAATVVAALTARASRAFPREVLVRSVLMQARNLGDHTLDSLLYGALTSAPDSERVGTPYAFLGHLPGLEQRYTYFVCSNPRETADGLRRTNTRFFLLTDRCQGPVPQIFSAAESARAVRVVFRYAVYTLYRVDDPDRLASALSAAR